VVGSSVPDAIATTLASARGEVSMMARIPRQAPTQEAEKRRSRTKDPFAICAATLVVPLLLVFTSFGAARAQDMQTLFAGRASHGGFGGPVVKFSDVGGSLGVWIGGRGGWIIGFEGPHSISLGGGGYGLASSHPVPDPAAAGWPGREDLRVRAGYGGFELEYTNRSQRLLHWTASTLIGAGSVALETAEFPVTADEPAFFVLEPGLHGELNVTRFLRLHAGLSYRYTSGVDRAGFTDRDFSGVNGTIAFKFGGFP
jgi:hypothetical protein